MFYIFFTYFIQVRGEDFAVDLCGVLDLLKAVVLLMVRAQTVNLENNLLVLTSWQNIGEVPGGVRKSRGWGTTVKVDSSKVGRTLARNQFGKRSC